MRGRGCRAGCAVIRVGLVDDQPLVRTALQMVIAQADDMEVVGEAGDGAQAVRLAEDAAPDVIVMDIRMPGMDGIEATRRIAAGPSAAQVIVLTTFDEDEYVYGALRAGAAGFLVKDMALEEILGAIRVVAAGDALIAPGVTRRLIKDFTARPPSTAAAPTGRLQGITDREKEVLVLIGAGLTNTEIARELTISIATAKTYVTRLLAKLDARDRVHLVVLAYENGLAGPSRHP
ncbi:response regulator [Streptomyces sp. NPDC092307]|uniref:response regulator n=1 Tax=Streptomyces sp. NPDC092307 TaxID=3366013 RepID=UPI0037F3077A